MGTVTSVQDLEIWKLARELANEIFLTYSNSEMFSRDYELKNQINKSSGSVMDNIAEGFERSGRKEFIYFLSIAKGSIGELKSQLYRALDRKYISAGRFQFLLNKADLIGKKIGSLIIYLNSSTHKGSKFTQRVVQNQPVTRNSQPETNC